MALGFRVSHIRCRGLQWVLQEGMWGLCVGAAKQEGGGGGVMMPPIHAMMTLCVGPVFTSASTTCTPLTLCLYCTASQGAC
jgi:hypothetical protein